MEKGPVFVAGLERTGTSLMFALLASHPGLAMTRRTNMWTYFYDQYGDLSQPENFEQCLGMMLKYKRLVKLMPDADRIRREFQEGERTYGRLFALFEEHYAEQVGKPRWGDKSLNTERYTDAIMAAYPGARILHMVRDPRDRYASVIARWKVRRGDVGAGTGMWLSSAGLAQANRQRYPDQYKVIRYETLAADPEGVLREICDFIGEDYAPEMLMMQGQGAESFREQGGNSSYGQRKSGVISTNSIGRFRKVLSPRQIACIQILAKQEMLALDYQLDPIQLPLKDRLLFAVADWPRNFALLQTWRVREAVKNRTGRKLPDYRIIPEASTT